MLRFVFGNTHGNFRIVDRKKDLVKLQHGEYISYGKIESILKTNPIVDNICVYADPYQDFCLAIVIPSVVELASLSSLPAKDAIKEQAVIEHVASTVAKYGLKMGLEKFECPKKVLLTLDEWTPDNGLVTASFKLRRRFIEKRYEAELAFLFT